MDRLTENKIVLVVRATRLSDLKARFATNMQAKFYVSRLGGDFADYEKEDSAYQTAIAEARQILSGLGRVQIVQRALLPNFVFGPEDIVVALGQDGLVANTLKYLNGQPLVGVNPDPQRWDGRLLPFKVRDLDKIVREVLLRGRPMKSVTMAKVTLNTGPTLHAVNDFFIGPRTHISARYQIRLGEVAENHSSSGVIISTGLGSTGWLKSLLTGAAAITQSAESVLGSTGHWPVPSGDSPDGIGVMAGDRLREIAPHVPVGGSPTASGGSPGLPMKARRKQNTSNRLELNSEFAWDADYLYFTVREPFPTRTTGASLVFGRVTAQQPLIIESQMGENGVIFSDGIEQDFLEFNSGTRAMIGIADRKGVLVE
jgi:NAD kinase